MPDLRPTTLKGIAWSFGIALALTSLAIASVGYRATFRLIDNEIDRRLGEIAQEIIGTERLPNRQAVIRRLLERESGSGANDTGFMLLDSNGRKIAGLLEMVTPPAGFSDIDFSDQIDGIHRGRALSMPIGDGSTLVVVADGDVVDDFDHLLLRVFALGFGGSVLIFVTGVTMMISTVRRRMKEIRSTAQAIADGDLAQRLTIGNGGDEFALEAAAFNSMLDRIAELVSNLKGVSDDIAHDLRTPLTKLRYRLVALRDRPGAKSVRDDIQGALDQCDHILSLVAAILRISEIEGHRRREHFVSVRLDELARSVSDAFTVVIAEGGRELRTVAPAAVTVVGDPGLLQQMIVNLVENAMHYTPPGSVIRIEVDGDSTEATLRVADNGPGIPPEARALALRRFGRLTSDSTHRAFGLGLSLAVAIANLHQGSLELGDAEPGLVVSVTLPRHGVLAH